MKAKKQKPIFNSKGLIRVLEREERLAEALRQNLKRRRVRSASMKSGKKSVVT